MFKPADIEPPFQLATLHLDDRDLVVPCLEVAWDDKPISLNWGNTLVRCFYFQQEMNHAELRLEGVLKGVRLPDSILVQMQGYGFPTRFDPLADEQTIEWFTSLEARELESEIDDLLG